MQGLPAGPLARSSSVTWRFLASLERCDGHDETCRTDEQDYEVVDEELHGHSWG